MTRRFLLLGRTMGAHLKTFRKARNACSRRSGLTLIEVLLSVFVLAVAVAAVISATTHTLVGIRQNEVGILATNAVVRKMELLKNLPFDDPSGTNDLVGQAPTTPFADGLEALPGATGTIAVCDYDLSQNPPPCETTLPFGNTNVLRVTVSVTVSAGRTFQLATLVSRELTL